MELARLVDLVGRVRATTRKTEKVGLLADFLRQTQGRETELAALYLTGTLRQGKIGLGWLTMQPAMTAEPASGEPPSLLDVDRAFEAIAAEQGPGSSDRKVRILRGLLERAEADARRFLAELVMGELRQGALEGLLRDAAFEYKLDGARIQVHKAGDEVRVFTRQLQDVTERVPEVVGWARGLPPRELVLEGEAIALRPSGKPQPFQVTMRRLGRSKDVAAARQELHLSSFFFDCLFLEGEGPLVGLPYAERADRLARTVPPGSLLPRIVTRRPEEAQRFLEQSRQAGHEGLMAKSLAAPYAAGQRGYHWLKLKSARTLDLVVLAAEWGSGRRKGWLSNLHLGARDPESGLFVMLGKTFKGLTDEMLRWQTEKLLSLEERRDDWTVYVRPDLVVEVAFSDVQESPRYPAGLALRFARVKHHRPDKPPREADTIQAVSEIFRQQRA